ncbi:hypothetical protein ACL1G7_11515, partial [Corynebacterium striatum]
THAYTLRGPSTKECPKTTPGTRYPHRSVLDTALPVLNSVARQRGMRGFDGFAMLLTVLVAASNALRVIGYLRRGRDAELAPTPPRGGRPRKKRFDDHVIGLAWGNAPPAEEAA